MKRVVAIIVIALVSFALGWMTVCVRVQTLADGRIARVEAGHANEVARIRQRIYGPTSFSDRGISPDGNGRLERFDLAASKGAITLSYKGGLGGVDVCLRVQADGCLFVIDHGVSRKVAMLDQVRCTGFFRRVLTSGILSFSRDVVELKLDLTHPNMSGGVVDAPATEVQISVPELDIDKRFSVRSLNSDLKHYPDMIEFQLISQLEDEIQGFVPKDDPFWK